LLVGASWSGEASAAYATSSIGVALAFTTGAAACRDAASACRHLAHDLQDARQRAFDAATRGTLPGWAAGTILRA